MPWDWSAAPGGLPRPPFPFALSLAGGCLTEAELRQVKELAAALDELDLSQAKVVAAGLKELRGLKGLSVLRLRGAQTADGSTLIDIKRPRPPPLPLALLRAAAHG
jgi:hypothetical protein